MRKKFYGVLGAIILSASILSGCGNSGVSQEDYNALNATCESLESSLKDAESQNNSLSVELESVNNELNAAISERNSIQSEYESYKESMAEYEGLAAAEAEARRIEAESIAAAESIAEAEAEAAAEAEAEAAAKAGYETGITYDQIARTPDDFEGSLVKFSGRVIQVIEGATEIQIRFAVNDDYDTVLFGYYSPGIVTSRVLEDDMITIYGTSVGLISYESTMGGNITIPAVSIDKIDQQ